MGTPKNTKESHIIGGSFANSLPGGPSLFKNTAPPEFAPPSLADLEKSIKEKGEKARLESLEKRNRGLFIGLYGNPEVVESNTNIINSALNLKDLINKILENKINIISPDPDSGIFKIYANDYILEQLNFISKCLGPDSIESSTVLLSEAKLRAGSLTRSCGLRYKVRDLLTGVN